MYEKVADLLNAKWLIHHDAIVGYIPSFISFINGSKLAADPSAPKTIAAHKKAYAINKAGNIEIVDRYDLMAGDVPELSIAVIPIQGALTSSDTMNIAKYVQLAEQNPNVISILFLINTPGGMVFYTDICANVIKNCTKPTVGVVMNMCASAGMWLASAMDRIIVTSEMDRLGSIGVMTSYMNIDAFLKEKLGISREDIYATKSTKKNFQFKQLMSGNNKPVIDELDFTNEIFHRTIINNLGIGKDSPIFEGDTYFADEAIALGLAHERNSIDYAVEYALNLGYKSSFKNNSKS